MRTERWRRRSLLEWAGEEGNLWRVDGEPGLV